VPGGPRNTTEVERHRARGQERIATPPLGLAAVEDGPTQTRHRAAPGPPAAEPEEVYSSEVEALDTSEAGAALPGGSQPSGELPPVDEAADEAADEVGIAAPALDAGEEEPSGQVDEGGTAVGPRPRNRSLSVVILLLLAVVGAIGVALALKRQGLLPVSRPPLAPQPTQALDAGEARAEPEEAPGTEAADTAATEEAESDADEPDGGRVLVEADDDVVVSVTAKKAAPAAPAKKRPAKKRKHR
jgi:hypothetical protein